MPIRRVTLVEAAFPKTSEFARLAADWTQDAAVCLLTFVWAGYDLLKAELLGRVDIKEADADLERSITQLLEPRIRRAMSGDEPFDIQHGSYEHETSQPPPAQPPQYDLAFVLRANDRIMWPLEAKLIRSEGGVARYTSELKANFLTCRYAPFSREAAMLGYLLITNTEQVFENISRSVPCTLARFDPFASRPHRTSSHLRRPPAGKSYARRFRCHHLLLVLVS